MRARGVTQVEGEAGQPSETQSAEVKLTAPLYQKIHRVEGEAYLDERHVKVNVGAESPFESYITASADLTKAQTAQSGSKASAPTPLREVIFAQPWLPMKAANEVLVSLPQRRRPSKLGAYLVDGDRRWWVTQSWRREGLVASSTHLAHFAILRDPTPPKIGDPRWDMEPPLGPRLVIPISDDLSGLGRVKLMWDGREAPIEVQRSWERIIYRPLKSFDEGQHRYRVTLRDRSGSEVVRSGVLRWPPEPSLIIPKDAEERRALEPTHK